MSAGKEVERKFLVVRLPDLDAAHAALIRQGYLTAESDTVEVRLRQKGTNYFITHKKGAGLERYEHEADIGKSAFETLWPATKGCRVEKMRWTGGLPGGLAFELDIFDGALAGLKLVEVEFATREDAARFEPPDWFGRDVTGDPTYSNATLARGGVPDKSK